MDFINLRNDAGDADATVSKASAVHFASCVECTACNDDAEAGTPAGRRIARSNCSAAKSRLETRTPFLKRTFLQLPTFSALMAALDPPLIGEWARETHMGQWS
jgi:hypothetical protein